MIDHVRREALSKLRQMDIELIEPEVKITSDGKGLRSNVEEVCQRCVRDNIDLALVLFCSWVSEDLSNTVATELFKYPMLCWAVTEPAELISISGLASSASNFVRLGKEFTYVIGSPNDQGTMKKILKVAKAAAIANRLRRARIGVVGYANPGMIGTTADEIELRALGPELVHLDLLSLITRFEKVNEKRAAAEAETLISSVGKVTAKDEDIKNSVKLYLALKDLVTENRLDAIGVRCWPELREGMGLTVCYALSRLSDEGIPGIDENDVTGGTTQLIMHWLSGRATFNGDLRTVDIKNNVVQLWHCGSAPTSLASSMKHVEVREHCQTKRGAVLEFALKKGKVTLAKLSRTLRGKNKMLIATGKARETSVTRGNIVNVEIDVPVITFMDKLIREGFEHHIVLAYGDIKDELLELCSILRIEPVTA